jgi:hypothetical protein
LGYVRKLDRTGIEFGVRYWDMELEINPALIAGRKRDDSWTDAWIGIRIALPLGEKWTLGVRITAGAGGSDSTFGAGAQFGRELSSGNQFVVGAKMLAIDYFEESLNGVPFEVDTIFLGGTIGFLFD